jgi:Fe-S-cluster containining protein
MAKPKTLQDIYNSMPTIECQGLCQECCGPIAVLPAELQKITESKQSVPTIKVVSEWGNLTCSALNDKGRCSIYENRPMICRLYGLVQAMACPYGCKPSRWVSDREAAILIERVRKLKPGEPYISKVEGSILELPAQQLTK